MLKKLFILVLLLAVVISVSYYKTILNKEGSDAAFDLGQQSARLDNELQKSLSDSLATELTGTSEILAAMMAATDTIRLAENDSLRSMIESHQQELAALTQAKTTAAKKPVGKRKTASVDQQHKNIIAYYNKLYNDLPKDLSAYERRVSLAEIRETAANKFSITLNKLNLIRESNGLTY